ncbi:MAG: hypothetical protein KDI88_17565 [Gammaproteobacteria bacterium]|nr:hypothetical protein [Gammaproteobacteria bacterium]
MTKPSRPSTASLSPVDATEPHFGDLRKGAFLRRLNAYRAKTGDETGKAGYQYANACLAVEPLIT